MAQYKLAHIDMKGNRSELHDLLNLTGAEVSCNTLPAGASVPFVHHHTQNEEVYLILEGKGMLYIDGEELPLKEGDCFRIDPQGERCLRAADDMGKYICVGVFGMIAVQIIINIGMCLGLLPVIGVTLPFYSAGGSSVLMLYICVGLVLSVYTHNTKKLFG